MAASSHPQTLHGPLLHKHQYLGTTNFTQKSKYFTLPPKNPFKNVFKAKFNLYEMMGGRGLCNGEEGLQRELEKPVEEEEEEEEASQVLNRSSLSSEENPNDLNLNISKEDAFEKELLGLTGGFPGGEKGLKKFIEQNPPPK